MISRNRVAGVDRKTSKRNLPVSQKRTGKWGPCELGSVCRSRDLPISSGSFLKAAPVMELHCQVMVAVKAPVISKRKYISLARTGIRGTLQSEECGRILSLLFFFYLTLSA